MKKKKLILNVSLIIFFAISIILFFNFKSNYFAYEDYDKDGKYKVEIDKSSIKMGKNNFLDYVYIEKYNNNFYLTFILKKSENLSDLNMILNNNKVNKIEWEKDNLKHYTFSISKKQIDNSVFNFNIYIVPMKTYKNLEIKLKNNTKQFLSTSLFDLGVRKAQFSPIIKTDLEIEKNKTLNSILKVPLAKAIINNQECEVKEELIFENKIINIPKDRIILLNKIGKYTLNYFSESNLYLDMNKKPSSTTLTFEIIVSETANEIVKVLNNLNGKYSFNANYLKAGNEFNKIDSKIKNITNNYQIIKLNSYNNNTLKEEKIDSKIKIRLKVDEFFDKNKIKVFTYDGQNIKEINHENYGSYIEVEEKTPNTFIICGQNIKKPINKMIVYTIILVVSIIVIISIIVLIIILKKKKSKKSI